MSRQAVTSKHQAWAKARSLWGRASDTPQVGDRYSWVSVRQKSVTDRFEVGYQEITHVGDGTGCDLTRYDTVVLGKGPSWDAAFDSAAKAAG